MIGVLPDAATAFPLNHQPQIWVLRRDEAPYLAPSQLLGGSYFFRPIARLKPGVSLEQAREAMNVIVGGLRGGASGKRRRAVGDRAGAAPVPMRSALQRESYLLLCGGRGRACC